MKLLQTAKLILQNTIEYSENLNNKILEIEKNTIEYSEKTKDTILEVSKYRTTNPKDFIESIKLKNPIPYPDLLETIIYHELVSKNMSEYSRKSIYSGLINIRKLAKYETADYYLKLLEEMRLILDLEIE